MVSVDGVGSHGECDAQDDEEHVGECPPGIVGVLLVNICYDGAHESYEPAGL